MSSLCALVPFASERQCTRGGTPPRDESFCVDDATGQAQLQIALGTPPAHAVGNTPSGLQIPTLPASGECTSEAPSHPQTYRRKG